MSKPNLRRWFLVGLMSVLAYPAFVLGYTWSKVLNSDLPGGRHGPLDAYRHTLASAIVAYTLNETVVDWASMLMENSGRIGDAMDRHNNRIGAALGRKASRFADIEPAVLQSIRRGQVNAPLETQSTWLPPDEWRQGRLW